MPDLSDPGGQKGTGSRIRLSVFADEGISLSIISQRRMSAIFDRRIANSALERRLSGGKTHLWGLKLPIYSGWTVDPSGGSMLDG